MSEAVDHPQHYGGKDNPYEAIKVIEAWDLGFHLGNAVKYISRAGKKDPAKVGEDIDKAIWYLQRYLEATFEKTKAKPPLVSEAAFHEPPSCFQTIGITEPVTEGPVIRGPGKVLLHVEDDNESCGRGCPVYEAKRKESKLNARL